MDPFLDSEGSARQNEATSYREKAATPISGSATFRHSMSEQIEVSVANVDKLLSVLGNLPVTPESSRFFRGQTEFGLKRFKPGIYQGRNLIYYEQDIIREALVRSPADFPSSCTFFEKLVRLQHYGLPTRLLDVTSNALVALFFACWKKRDSPGELIVFDIPKSDVKYFDGDTPAVISNLARQPWYFEMPEPTEDIDKFNREPAIDRLFYDVCSDKPAFRPWIKPA